MKRKYIYIAIALVAALCMLVGLRIYIARQSEIVGALGVYYNAVKSPTKDDAVYEQEIKSDIVEIGIEVLKVETIEGAPARYKLIVNLANATDTPYGYKVTLLGYSGSLICFTSNTNITYAENYSDGDSHNGKTICYFTPKSHKSADQNVGTSEFDLRRNDPTIDIGYVVVEVSAYYPFFWNDINQQTITQQIYFDLAESE